MSAVASRPLFLPARGGGLRRYELRSPRTYERPRDPLRSRCFFAAAHVVADPFAEPWAIDWDRTLAYRHELWSWGLGVAEAMDTAQRGGGTVGWDLARELIRRSAEAARPGVDRLACGVGTDQLAPDRSWSITEIGDAYEEQCAFVEECGAQPVVMASRILARSARSTDDYHRVYDRILGQVRRPAIIHWLGPMFDPELDGYWGGRDVEAAVEVVVDIIRRHAERVDGIKLSLLDADLEVSLRRRLPDGVRMYTGDDFNYPPLIEGDDERASDALLGIFDAIAPAASAAAQALDRDDQDGFGEVLAPTVPLARHIFQAPTAHYKAGIVFLAYLNGHQDHFKLVDGLESARSIVHLAELFELADEAGLLSDGERASSRMREALALAGIRS
jgi:hypothetical protein